jgi:predicted transcriptional regulator
MATYRLKIVRGDREFEAEGDKRFVLDMLKRFEQSSRSENGKVGSGIDLRTDESPTPQPSKGISLREFVRRLGLKKHTDIVVAFAYYLEKYTGVTEFTPADINNCYYEAKMETSNTSQMIIQNIKRGYVMEAKKRDKAGRRYTITDSGERFIQQKLDAIAE